MHNKISIFVGTLHATSLQMEALVHFKILNAPGNLPYHLWQD